jgi:hypothetical protein
MYSTADLCKLTLKIKLLLPSDINKQRLPILIAIARFDDFFRYAVSQWNAWNAGTKRRTIACIPPKYAEFIFLGTCKSASVSLVRQKSYWEKSQGGGKIGPPGRASVKVKTMFISTMVQCTSAFQ